MRLLVDAGHHRLNELLQMRLYREGLQPFVHGGFGDRLVLSLANTAVFEVLISQPKL